MGITHYKLLGGTTQNSENGWSYLMTLQLVRGNVCVRGGGRLNQWLRQRDSRCDTAQQRPNVPDKSDLTDVRGLE